MSGQHSSPDGRGQSHVVGVVLLLGVTVVALGGLTATVGSVVDGQTAAADEARVSNAFVEQLRPVEHTGHNEARVQFSDGRLSTVQRELRILRPAGVQRTIRIGGLVYTAGRHRAAFVGGAVVRGPADNAWLEDDPPMTVGTDGNTLVVGAPKLDERGASVSSSVGTTVRLRTNVSHARTTLGTGEYSLAIETRTTKPFARSFRELGATTRTAHFDSDGVPSVVASFDGPRTVHLVVHDMRLEVDNG